VPKAVSTRSLCQQLDFWGHIRKTCYKLKAWASETIDPRHSPVNGWCRSHVNKSSCRRLYANSRYEELKQLWLLSLRRAPSFQKPLIQQPCLCHFEHHGA
jgi:hypothetical protein